MRITKKYFKNGFKVEFSLRNIKFPVSFFSNAHVRMRFLNNVALQTNSSRRQHMIVVGSMRVCSRIRIVNNLFD